MTDHSNGYERIAADFIKIRSKTIGAATVETWSKTLSPGASILDLGCGSGIPISKVLIDLRFNVYGIDASPSLTKEFRKNFPNSRIHCEAVENSFFFNLKFDSILAWGLLFLLSEDVQKLFIEKVAQHLQLGGKFLFTAPIQKVLWKDSMTGLPSRSLGEEKYREILKFNGFGEIEVFNDEADNFYYSSIKLA